MTPQHRRKKNVTAATNAQNKAERDAAGVAEQYARKMADLSVAIDVQKVRATEGEKASELYADLIRPGKNGQMSSAGRFAHRQKSWQSGRKKPMKMSASSANMLRRLRI